MNKLISILITVIFILSVSINSCSKIDTPINSTTSQTDKCHACDSMKESIRNTPELKDYLNYIDSLFCWQDATGAEYCNFNTFSSKIRDSFGYELFGDDFQIGSIFLTKNPNFSNIFGTANHDYNYIYFCYQATKDTPYVSPIVIWMDYNEGASYNSSIDGIVSEFSQFYNPDKNRYTRNISPSFSSALQNGDTISFWKYKTTITDKGVNKDYRKWYYVILSPDRETAKLIVKYYTYGSSNQLVKTIDNFTLKRWHKP